MKLHGGGGGNRAVSKAEIQKALEEMRGYEEFAAIEEQVGAFNLKVDYTVDGSKYDPTTHTIIINPADLNTEYAAVPPPGFEESLGHLSDDAFWNAVDNYPKWNGFKIQRVLFHEASHALQPASGLKYHLNPGRYEMPVINRTNQFMHKYFNDPYRKDHTTIRY